MKVLYFVNGLNYKGGIARIVVDKMNYLSDFYGYGVTVCTLNNSSDCYYPISSKVKVIPMGGGQNLQSSLLGKIKKLISMPNSINRIIQNGNYDIVINAQTQLVTWVLPFICKNVPKIMEIHFSHVGMECNIRNRSKLFKMLYWKIVNLIYSKYNRFVILTQEDRRYWNLENISVINNFTHYKKAKLGERQGKTIICVARYHEQKRLDLLIHAWQIISKKYPKWRIEVYGMGPDKKMLQEEVDRCGLHNSFIINDAVDNIEEKYAESDIFALSSEHEGFALVLLEAMAASLPVCAFNVVGVGGIVEHEKTGLLCDFPNVELFAQNLSRLIDNPSFRKELGKNGNSSIEKYSENKIMSEWNDLITEIITINKR